MCNLKLVCDLRRVSPFSGLGSFSAAVLTPRPTGCETMKEEMFVVAFEGMETASQMLTTLEEMDDNDIIELEDAAVIVRNLDGTLEFSSDEPPDAGEGVVDGAERGSVLGAGSGGVGVVVGAIVGAIQGIFKPRTVDTHFRDEFLLEISDALQPGYSAIVAIVEFEQSERAMQILDRFSGGKILKHTLTQEHLAELSRVVED
jgi:uncharacterized membrane protein